MFLNLTASVFASELYMYVNFFPFRLLVVIYCSGKFLDSKIFLFVFVFVCVLLRSEFNGFSLI